LEEKLGKDVVCAHYIQPVQQTPYQGGSSRVLRLHNRRTSNLYCEILLAKEETVLQGMINRLIEIGRCYGIEMNVEKTKVMRISRQPYPIKIMTDKKQLEIVEYFNYLGSMITKDARSM
jgi:hypothetical protein